jgi:putative hydrolase of the HAD superfamily
VIRFLLLDLDNTLYQSDSGLWEAIGHRINQYMIERLGFHPDEVKERRDAYLHLFGTTLNALRHYYHVDADDFLKYVHDIPLELYLPKNPELDSLLARLPQRKVIFTNADAPHAERVLGQLGIRRHFDQIFDIHGMDFICKPDPRAYERVLEAVGVRPDECVFADDSLQNLVPAKVMGMTTILVGPETDAAGADFCIRNILEMEALLKQDRRHR